MVCFTVQSFLISSSLHRIIESCHCLFWWALTKSYLTMLTKSLGRVAVQAARPTLGPVIPAAFPLCSFSTLESTLWGIFILVLYCRGGPKPCPVMSCLFLLSVGHWPSISVKYLSSFCQDDFPSFCAGYPILSEFFLEPGWDSYFVQSGLVAERNFSLEESQVYYVPSQPASTHPEAGPKGTRAQKSVCCLQSAWVPLVPASPWSKNGLAYLSIFPMAIAN